MTNTNQLPETQRPVDHVIEPGQEMSTYQSIIVQHQTELARAIGIQPTTLSFRIYGERIMWRCAFVITKDCTRDEAKRGAWTFVTRVFGAYKPEFFKADAGTDADFVATWFTDGVFYANKAIKF